MTWEMRRRRHLYGDVYSSPGLGMRQKQVLMVAFLGQADMQEQLFGHLLAARPPPQTLHPSSHGRLPGPGATCRSSCSGTCWRCAHLLTPYTLVLMVAFLGQADMQEQLFGHLLAVRPPPDTLPIP